MRVATFLIVVCACGQSQVITEPDARSLNAADARHDVVDASAYDASTPHDAEVVAWDAVPPPPPPVCDMQAHTVVRYANGTSVAYRFTVAALGASVPPGRVLVCSDNSRFPHWLNSIYADCSTGELPCSEQTGAPVASSCNETPVYLTEVGYVAVCTQQTEYFDEFGNTTGIFPAFDPTARIEIHQ